jgi:hypothetical protein
MKAKHDFIADPFLIENGGSIYLFAEYFNSKRGKGEIIVFERQQNIFVFQGTCLSLPTHLSFPYVFKVNSEIYLLPESQESNQVILFKAKSFPLEWEKHVTLLDNIRIADPLVISRDGGWFLIGCSDKIGSGFNDSEFSIFHSRFLESANWVPSKLNPIFVDSTKGRNGGLLQLDNKIYRVSQEHGFDSYGSGIKINLIKSITLEEYVEIIQPEIKILEKFRIKRSHHLSNLPNWNLYAMDSYE